MVRFSVSTAVLGGCHAEHSFKLAVKIGHVIKTNPVCDFNDGVLAAAQQMPGPGKPLLQHKLTQTASGMLFEQASQVLFVVMKNSRNVGKRDIIFQIGL